MPTRAEQKQITRSRILDAAEKEVCQSGLQKLQTAAVAKAANVAHGTVFTHFPTKEQLILEILDRKLGEFTAKLNAQLHDCNEFPEVLNIYLAFLEAEEPFFVVLAQEIPILPENLRNQVLFREALIRSHFFRALKRGIANGQYKPVNITDFLSLLFGAIQYYLTMKPIFSPNENIIQKHKEKITKLIFQLIQQPSTD